MKKTFLILGCTLLIANSAVAQPAKIDSSLKEILEDTQYQLLSAQKDLDGLYEKNYELENSIKKRDALIDSLQAQNESLAKTLQTYRSVTPISQR